MHRTSSLVAFALAAVFAGCSSSASPSGAGSTPNEEKSPASPGEAGATGGDVPTTGADAGGPGSPVAKPPREQCTGAVSSIEDVAYATTHAKNLLDLHLPAKGAHCPVVVWIHGGGWKGGTKTFQAGAVEHVMPLVEAGYAVVSIDYRLSGDAIFPAQIQDVKAAIRFLRAHADQYRLDPTRIALWGTSAGGHLAALAGTSGGVAALEDLGQGNATFSSAVDGVVDCYGPTVLPAMDAELAANGCGGGGQGHNGPSSPESEFLGCTQGLQSCPAAVTASPITYVDAADPPMLLGHGLADCTVPNQQSHRLQDALKSVAVSAELVLAPDSGHEIESCPDDSVVTAFLANVLK